MRISEIFYSIQGEGILTGVPSVFVRTSGCPLRCVWCDTPYASWYPEGEQVSLEEILLRVSAFRARHVVVTGGEPMLAQGIETLCARLREGGYHITVETAGIAFAPIACDLGSLSPKLGNSTPHNREGGRYALEHDRARLRVDVLRAFLDHCPCQLKLVIDRPEDVEEVVALLALLPPIPREQVLLMPRGVTPAELGPRSLWLADLCKRHGFRFCPRLHIDLYGNQRGT